MPTRKAESYTLGAVDSRSNPANFPTNRSIRCMNWAPQENGALRLRSGYTVPMGAGNDTAGGTTIHTLIYYEQFSAEALGPQYCLYGKGNPNATTGSIFTLNLDTGASAFVGSVGTSAVGNPWGHYRFNNYIFVAAGGVNPGAISPSNGEVYSWDGSKWRLSGLPAFAGNQTGGFIIAGIGPTVSTLSSSAGDFTVTQLSGYQLFAAAYNPVTGHVGNCALFGERFTIGTTGAVVVLGYQGHIGTGIGPKPILQVVGSVDETELYAAIGMTNDGGQVPYWLVDGNGNNVVVSSQATIATVTLGQVNYLEELPFRNGYPPPMDKFARVGTRIFGNLQGSPFIYYSNDAADIQNANYVGNPWESWPLDQAEPFPTGELPTAIHGRGLEGWFFSRNYLAIFSSVLQQQGANPWRGPWVGGCAGQRAFVDTPYGPYWVSGNKQLCTFMDDGVISVSEEYETALLGKIADANLAQVEVGFLLDPQTRTSVIVIKGTDVNGNPVIVVHDFLLKDERSPFGCGYNYLYTGLTIQTFAGAGYTPRQNVYDTTAKMRLWVGATQGFIAQIEDGSNSDNGATYSADHIGIIGLGSNRPSLAELEWQGDPNVQVSYAVDYSQSTTGFSTANADLIPGETSRYGAKFGGEEGRWLYTRLQLDAHPEDGNFQDTDPPFSPMPVYGLIGEVTLKLGRERPEGR